MNVWPAQTLVNKYKQTWNNVTKLSDIWINDDRKEQEIVEQVFPPEIIYSVNTDSKYFTQNA